MVKKKQMGLYLDEKTKDAVVRRCTKEDRKISEIVRALLKKWLAGQVHV